MKSPVIKRTVHIDGRKTGVSVEDAFWSTLMEIADAQGVTVSQMVTEIEKSRQGRNLPSIRLASTFACTLPANMFNGDNL